VDQLLEAPTVDPYFETLDRQRVWLSPPEDLNKYKCEFKGRQEELRLCQAAFAIQPEWSTFDDRLTPLHFRLEGPPGVGKNEIVYEIAKRLAASMKLPFYMIQGHEEMTPEDLSILVVPAAGDKGAMPLGLRASPLATALYEGGLFFFDEINRAPERALTPLASVLDGRCSLYSAITGIKVEPKNPEVRRRFRFCCAMNPEHGKTGRGGLSDYLEERTLPAIRVGYHDLDTLLEILRRNVTTDQQHLESFREWYKERTNAEVSVRQVLALVQFALRTINQDESLAAALERAADSVLRKDQLKAANADSAVNDQDSN
jgi:MoxR-like ATPase